MGIQTRNPADDPSGAVAVVGSLDEARHERVTPSDSTSSAAEAAPSPDWGLSNLRSTDIDELGETLRGWRQEYRQIARGPFEGEHTDLWLGDVRLLRVTFGTRMQSVGFPPAGWVGIGVVLEESEPAWWRGRELGWNDVSAFRGEDEFDFVSPKASFQAAGIHVSTDTLKTLLPEESGRLPADWLQLDTEERERLRSVVRRVLAFAEAHPSALDRPVVRRVLREALLRRFLSAATFAESEAEPNVRRRRYEAVRRAEAHIQANMNRDVPVSELCSVTGVSERTLRYGFQEFRGVSPAAYLKARRLHAVRRELVAADPAQGTVTDLAARWGFWHMGHFSTDYRRMFGERPSETLRRLRRVSLGSGASAT